MRGFVVFGFIVVFAVFVFSRFFPVFVLSRCSQVLCFRIFPSGVRVFCFCIFRVFAVFAGVCCVFGVIMLQELVL